MELTRARGRPAARPAAAAEARELARCRRRQGGVRWHSGRVHALSVAGGLRTARAGQGEQPTAAAGARQRPWRGSGCGAVGSSAEHEKGTQLGASLSADPRTCAICGSS